MLDFSFPPCELCCFSFAKQNRFSLRPDPSFCSLTRKTHSTNEAKERAENKRKEDSNFTFKLEVETLTQKQYWVETCRNGNWETRYIHLNCEREIACEWVQIHEDKNFSILFSAKLIFILSSKPNWHYEFDFVCWAFEVLYLPFPMPLRVL